MELQVKDIERIWGNGRASLVAGRNGLTRKVDYYDMMEQPNMREWLREHLLLITTGYAIRNNKEALLQLIRDMNEANASALAIKTRFFDEFPGEAIQLADELALPLFLLNNNSGFEEAVFPIMVALVNAKNNMELDTRYQIGRRKKSELDNDLFLDILTGKLTQEEEADYRTNSLQWPAVPVRILLLQLEVQGKHPELAEIRREQQISAADRVYNRYHVQAVTLCRKQNCICILGADVKEETLVKIAEELVNITEEVNHCSCFAMITEPIFDYLKLPKVYELYQESLRIRAVRKLKKSVLFLEDLQYDRILLHVSQQEEAQEFVRKKLGGLVEYDRINDSHLLETLEMLIRQNGSRKQAAEALYLHRNTMAHRIRKIEEILGLRLDEGDEMKQLEFACCIRQYL